MRTGTSSIGMSAVALAVLLLASSAGAAVIGLGDVVAVDLGNQAGTGANYNLFTTSATIPAGGVVRLSDGATVDGLSLTLSGVTGQNNPGVWPGTAADPYLVNAATDGLYRSPGNMDLTFNGLDSSLAYNVRTYPLINGEGGRIVDVTINGVELANNVDRQATWDSPTLEAVGLVFNGNPAPGGSLTVRFDADGDWFTANAVTLEAVTPPPPPPPIGPGDVIAVDLGNQAGQGANYNLFTGAGSIPAGSVVRFSDGSPIGGVALSLSGVSGQNNPGVWPGTAADPFLVNEATDGLYRSPGDMILTLTGLDDALSYDIRVYPLINGEGGRIIDVAINGAQVADNVDRQNTWDAAALEDVGLVFDGITPISGQIQILVNADANNDGNPDDWFTWNAVTVEADIIPEPTTLALLGLGGLALLRRRRRKQ